MNKKMPMGDLKDNMKVTKFVPEEVINLDSLKDGDGTKEFLETKNQGKQDLL